METQRPKNSPDNTVLKNKIGRLTLPKLKVDCKSTAIKAVQH